MISDKGPTDDPATIICCGLRKSLSKENSNAETAHVANRPDIFLGHGPRDEDDMTADGFIALQVHGGKHKETLGVRWRKIRILSSD